MDIILVRKPSRIKIPQEISKLAVKDAQNSGYSKPIFENLPTPTVSGVMNFCKPSERKTNPITKRGRRVGTGEALRIWLLIKKIG